ncbi:MAG: alpha/beta hydrolase [Gammaproteobacteria bacterium]
MHALLPLAAALLLTACATPAARFAETAAARGLVRTDVPGLGFTHAVFARAAPAPTADALHLYLEGDGTPWLGPGRIAADPTPREPLALELLARDPAPALLLGRPCYHAHAMPAACTPEVWTHARYGEAVIASLAAAAGTLLARTPRADVTLIGYSGGGALAVLLAPRLPRVRHVVTIAANLDVAAWSAHHDYSPLAGSRDPATLPPLPKRIRQVHLVGADDTQVPRALVARYLVRQPWATVRELAGFDHHCCWTASWPRLLEDALDAR